MVLPRRGCSDVAGRSDCRGKATQTGWDTLLCVDGWQLAVIYDYPEFFLDAPVRPNVYGCGFGVRQIGTLETQEDAGEVPL